jgi:hypothetical protein
MTENPNSRFRFSDDKNTPIPSDAVHLDLSGGDAPVNEGLETLRLLAELPPPAGLEDRMRQHLSRELATPKVRGFWSLWKPVQRLQYAAVAVLMAVIGVTGWTVMRERTASSSGMTPSGSNPPGLNQPTSTGLPVVPATSASGFGNASAERHPTTVKPIKVPPAPKKKPGASHLAKPSSKAEATQ